MYQKNLIGFRERGWIKLRIHLRFYICRVHTLLIKLYKTENTARDVLA